MKEKLEGLIAAPHTLFNSDGTVAYELIERQYEALIKQNVKGAFISGSTGEGVSCSIEERINIMQKWNDINQGKIKLIVHTGCLSLEDTKILAQYANKLKVFATSIVPPNYYRPSSARTLVDICKVAAQNAPDCGFYYYHTMLTNLPISMIEFLEIADKEIPNLLGIKFNSSDLFEYSKCLNFMNGKYDIIYGVDEFFLGALAVGAKSFIGSTYNYMADIYYNMWNSFNNNDLNSARNDMKKVLDSVDLLIEYGGVVAGKIAMSLHDIDAPQVRLPLQNYNATTVQEIQMKFSQILN